ncbi:acetyltransferase [Neolewinella antarctica]|uniref:Sugar O-acyltransferase (Sialic acid O-acetyltransferase NeuD family) n=1 Tax=Neolewinella antarctica TaxID=442734 RepID=A0ABX0XA35_9BACT|nr:acetyltransferase [Neolewinella antarctica]NJC26146.1 sugar O-acyltransferase (sialic acid O-acetyltransferase NeuD family) [Neolewinella antarctica]
MTPDARPIIIFGESQLASLAHFYLRHDSPHEVAAFTVDAAYRKTDTYEEKPLVDFETIQDTHPPAEYRMFLPVSFKQMSHLRREKFEAAKAKGYDIISYVSSKATTWPDLDVGENCFIFEDNTIQPFVKIGDNCVLWSGNHIGHHTTIGSHVFITSQVVISGACTIKDHAFFGVNATIRDETVIGEATLVGMGALVTKDTEPYSIHLGAKGKIARGKSVDIDSLSHKSGG